MNEEVQRLFKENPAELKSDYHEEITKDHGRIETRRRRQIEVNTKVAAGWGTLAGNKERG